MFVDASVIVAILTEESDGPELSSRIQQADALFTSPVAFFEAVSSVARKEQLSIPVVASATTSLELACASDSSSGINEHTLLHHSLVSASAKPACGEYKVAGRDAVARTPDAGSTSTPFVPVVPTSMPRRSAATSVSYVQRRRSDVPGLRRPGSRCGPRP